MRQRIEKAARGVGENLPPDLGKSEKLKARLDDEDVLNTISEVEKELEDI